MSTFGSKSVTDLSASTVSASLTGRRVLKPGTWEKTLVNLVERIATSATFLFKKYSLTNFAIGKTISNWGREVPKGKEAITSLLSDATALSAFLPTVM